MNDNFMDEIDWMLLDQLQRDASLSNQALAELAHTTPPTCLRRVKRLRDAGLIEKQITLLSPEHLAATLAAPPAQFHQQHRAARWRVAGRRSIPALLSLGLVAAAAAVPQLTLAPESVLRMLILNAPPLLLIGFFCLREVPRIEIPPLPRPLRQEAWQQTAEPASLPTHATLTT